MNFLNVLLIFALACCAHSYETSAGRCLDAPLIPDFSLEKFSGKWYEIERYSSWFEHNIQDVNCVYTYVDPQTLSAVNSGTKKGDTEPYTMNSTLHMENPELPNRLTETNRISVGDVPLLSKDFDYSVWKTDYDRYCVVYSCHQLLPLVLKAESLWIFGREKTLDPELLAELRTFAQENGVNVANLEMAVQN